MNKSASFSTLILPALKVALVVGSVLILINQYDAIFGEQHFRWLPALLTYCVPFTVFLAGRISANNTDESARKNKE